jgi:carbon storage regulator
MTVVGGAAPPKRLPWIEFGGPSGRISSNGGEMLVLTRKTNQSIMIGDDIEVSVLAVSRDKIRLGITAPRDIPVFRKEVYLSIKEEQMSEDHGARKHVDKALDELSTKE